MQGHGRAASGLAACLWRGMLQAMQADASVRIDLAVPPHHPRICMRGPHLEAHGPLLRRQGLAQILQVQRPHIVLPPLQGNRLPAAEGPGHAHLLPLPRRVGHTEGHAVRLAAAAAAAAAGGERSHPAAGAAPPQQPGCLAAAGRPAPPCTRRQGVG